MIMAVTLEEVPTTCQAQGQAFSMTSRENTVILTLMLHSTYILYSIYTLHRPTTTITLTIYVLPISAHGLCLIKEIIHTSKGL